MNPTISPEVFPPLFSFFFPLKKHILMIVCNTALAGNSFPPPKLQNLWNKEQNVSDILQICHIVFSEFIESIWISPPALTLMQLRKTRVFICHYSARKALTKVYVITVIAIDVQRRKKYNILYLSFCLIF